MSYKLIVKWNNGDIYRTEVNTLEEAENGAQWAKEKIGNMGTVSYFEVDKNALTETVEWEIRNGL